MLLRQLSRFLVAVLPMCAFAACSDQSPVAPQGVNGGLQSARPSGGTPGTYTMLAERLGKRDRDCECCGRKAVHSRPRPV